MNSFRNHRLRDLAVPISTTWLLNDIAEAKGKQELYTRQSPHVLKALREMALIQTTESSNRIEGVTAAVDELTRELPPPRRWSGQVVFASVSANGASLYQPGAAPQAATHKYQEG